MRKWKRTRKGLISATALIMACVCGLYAESVHPQTPSAANRSAVLAHLNAVINWYKKSCAQVQPGQRPSDAIYLTNAQHLAAEAVRLAFLSARIQVSLNPQGGSTGNLPSPANGQNGNEGAQKYAQMETDVSQRIMDDQNQIEAAKRQATAHPTKTNQDQQQALEGKLALDKATLEAVVKMKSFVDTTDSEGSGTDAEINDLARSVPEVFGTQAGAKADSVAGNSPTIKPQPEAATSTGLVGQLIVLYGLMQNVRRARCCSRFGGSLEALGISVRP